MTSTRVRGRRPDTNNGVRPADGNIVASVYCYVVPAATRLCRADVAGPTVAIRSTGAPDGKIAGRNRTTEAVGRNVTGHKSDRGSIKKNTLLF